jgi:hypothetical protein
LLQLAVVLFTLDVGVRRIQIDREEWSRLRRWLLFWQAPAQKSAAEESLGALLARREQVRSTKTAPAQPKPELFRPERPVEVSASMPAAAPPESSPEVSSEPPKAPEAEAGSTASRLLEAKRRAQRRKGGPAEK